MSEAKWWCTPCEAWREPRKIGMLGPMCPACGSGRIRPPMPGELDVATLAALPPLSPGEVKAQLNS